MWNFKEENDFVESFQSLENTNFSFDKENRKQRIKKEIENEN